MKEHSSDNNENKKNTYIQKTIKNKHLKKRKNTEKKIGMIIEKKQL